MAEAKVSNPSGLNLFQKLALVQQAVDVLQKDSSGYGYTYVSQARLLPVINSHLNELGVTLLPGIVPGTTTVSPFSYKKTKWNKEAKQMTEEIVNEFSVCGDMVYSWVNNDNPDERIEVPWTMCGNQSDSSQALGSALTYSERYFLLKYFHCATVDDDPDKIRSEQKQGQAKREVESVLDEVDAIVQDVIAESPSERENVRQIITKYVDLRDEHGDLVPTGDYRRITKKARAAGLLKELRNQYKTKEE